MGLSVYEFLWKLLLWRLLECARLPGARGARIEIAAHRESTSRAKTRGWSDATIDWRAVSTWVSALSTVR